jgi:hypothetical protein
MKLIDSENEYLIAPTRDGDSIWLCIAKNGIQIGNPELDANKLAKLINELKQTYFSIIEGRE